MTTDDSTPSFARDIQPMFRDLDRRSMRYIFDLWNYEDVRANAESILERLNDGGTEKASAARHNDVLVCPEGVHGRSLGAMSIPSGSNSERRVTCRARLATLS